MKLHRLPFYGFFYQNIMRIAHKYNWHYAPPIYPDGDTQLWCKWCGFRETIKKKGTSNESVLHKIGEKQERFGNNSCSR